jgi:hypothetical protein
MKKLFGILFVAVALLLSGCSFRDGIYVVFRSQDATHMKTELHDWVAARGFQMREQSQPEEGFFFTRPGPEEGRIGLFASFQSSDGRNAFFIGKGNSRKFTEEEVAILDECAAWLASRSDSIERGFASKSSTTGEARRKFYEKIKKDA